MADKEHDTTVINTGSDSGGGAVWFIAGAALIIALIVGIFYLGEPTGNSLDVNVGVETPAGDTGSSGSDSSATGGSAGGDAGSNAAGSNSN